MFLTTWPENLQVAAIRTYLAPLNIMLHPKRQSGHVIILMKYTVFASTLINCLSLVIFISNSRVVYRDL